METRSTVSKMKRSERTVRETMPDGRVRVRTIIEETTPDGRTTTLEKVTIDPPNGSGNVRPINAAPTEERKRSIGRFTLPKFFQSIGRSDQSKLAKEKVSSATAGDSVDFNLADFRQQLLRLQNSKRAQHGASDLVMSNSLNAFAQEWAEKLAESSQMKHRSANQYGENIYMGYNSAGPVHAHEVIDSWYSEVKTYDYNHPSTSCGHFTQMVWKASKEVGFGCAVSKDGSMYVVANYSPPGNMLGQFKENVGKPRS